MQDMVSKKLVQDFLFYKGRRNIFALKHLLSENLHFKSPIALLSNREQLLGEIQRNRDSFVNLDVKKIIADGNEVCSIYTQESEDPNIGIVLFTEWYKIEDGRIRAIESNFNAKPIIDSRAQI